MYMNMYVDLLLVVVVVNKLDRSRSIYMYINIYIKGLHNNHNTMQYSTHHMAL